MLLPDVNFLLALAWPNHEFHRAAKVRLGDSTEEWATCALTQLGFIRTSSNPAFTRNARTPAQAAALLGGMIQDSLHRFLDCSIPPALNGEGIPWTHVGGHKQITDAYLLRLATKAGAKLLTFDRKLTNLAPAGVLEVAPPAVY